MGEKKNACRLLVGKPEGKRLLGKPRRRWVNNIRLALGEVGWGDVDWIGPAQDENSKYCYSFEFLYAFLILRSGVFSRLCLYNINDTTCSGQCSAMSTENILRNVVFIQGAAS
jgi:hypothetical protein